ncbi:MAG: HIG1 domain-containing protein [Rickettsiaceae bacterium]
MILVLFFTIITTIILLIGIFALATGRNFNKKYGTKLMALRVILQGCALLSVVLIYCTFL